MTDKFIKILWPTVLLLVAMYLSGAYTQIAKASVAVFAPTTCKTATATTTLAYMTPGTATTTVTCNLGLEGAVSAVVLEQLTGSSTATVLVTTIEYSQNGVDWYQNNQDVYAAGAIAVATPSNSFTWTFATSTIGGLVNGGPGVDVGTKILKISTPTAYVRAVITLTGANGGVWAQIVPRQSIN